MLKPSQRIRAKSTLTSASMVDSAERYCAGDVAGEHPMKGASPRRCDALAPDEEQESCVSKDASGNARDAPAGD